MEEDNRPIVVVVALVVLLLGFVLGLRIFQSSQEAKAFNRCHPGANVTTWEAVWAEYRIMDCEVKD